MAVQEVALKINRRFERASELLIDQYRPRKYCG